MAGKAKPTKESASAKKASEEKEKAYRLICDNRKARFEFEIMETIECGLVLSGTEVKALRQGHCSLNDSFARIEDGETWLYNCNISQYEYGNRFNHEPTRKRKLLMHAHQIFKINQRIKEKGLTLIPLKMYFKRNWVKVDLALARGKHLYDKRDSINKRESKRQLDRLAKQVRRV